MALNKKIKRIALLGMHLESNSFAPICLKDSFYSLCYLEGDEVLDDIKSDNPKQPVEISSFFHEMNSIGIPWEAVPILVTASEPNGPCNQEFFNNTCDKMRELLYAADPLDGVYYSKSFRWHLIFEFHQVSLEMGWGFPQHFGEAGGQQKDGGGRPPCESDGGLGEPGRPPQDMFGIKSQ